jgi:hypothetical protein
MADDFGYQRNEANSNPGPKKLEQREIIGRLLPHPIHI